MRNQFSVLRLLLLLICLGIFTQLFAYQDEYDMMITKVMNDKLAGDLGRSSGIVKGTVYIIWQDGNAIGKAKVIAVKGDACALEVVDLKRRKKVKEGDLLAQSMAVPQTQTTAYTPPPPSSSDNSNKVRLGIRGGVGTDINGGIAYGGVLNALLGGRSPFEIGIVVFGGSFEETTEEFNTYVETTDIFVFGALANYLVSYPQNGSGVFLVVGAGGGAISVTWEERSDTDESLGTPLPGGGSKQEAEGSAGGFIANLGFGYKFKGNADIRFEVPTFFIGEVGEAAGVVPTFMATFGVRF